jgi:hypothetical protein
MIPLFAFQAIIFIQCADRFRVEQAAVIASDSEAIQTKAATA